MIDDWHLRYCIGKNPRDEERLFEFTTAYVLMSSLKLEEKDASAPLLGKGLLNSVFDLMVVEKYERSENQLPHPHCPNDDPSHRSCNNKCEPKRSV